MKSSIIYTILLLAITSNIALSIRTKSRINPITNPETVIKEGYYTIKSQAHSHFIVNPKNGNVKGSLTSETWYI